MTAQDSPVSEIVRRLRSPNDEVAIAAANTLGTKGFREAVPALLEVLQNTDVHALRNAVAIALADLQAPEALSAIATAIRSEATAGHRGTLIHALGHFDCSGEFQLLVDTVANDTWEARHEAFRILNTLSLDLDEVAWSDAVSALRAALEGAEGEGLHRPDGVRSSTAGVRVQARGQVQGHHREGEALEAGKQLRHRTAGLTGGACPQEGIDQELAAS